MSKEGDKDQQYLSQKLLQELWKMIEEKDNDIRLLKKKLDDLRYSTLNSEE
jgi:hypothetical protein